METQLTVSSIRAIYESLASSPSSFLSELNEITARLLNRDIWAGCSDEVLFPASADGYFVLPRQFVAVLGYDFNNVPRSIFGRFHQYIECGYGWQCEENMCLGGLIEDGFMVTQKTTSGTFYLRVKPSVALDASKQIRLYGLDAQSVPQPIMTSGVDGIQLIIGVPQSTTIQKFTSLTGIQAPAGMLGEWSLWQVDATTGVETQVGSYQPGETAPSYRKYKIGHRTTNDVIRCFCRRQWVAATSETDWIFPRCLPAIKMGFKALQLEDASKYGGDNTPNADTQWTRAENELDAELAVLRGGELPSLKIFGGPYPMCGYRVN